MLAIALANKLARIVWAVLARGRSYQPRIAAGLSLSQPRMRADTHDGPEQIAPLQRPDTLMQLSRSLSWKSILYRTAGPYIWH